MIEPYPKEGKRVLEMDGAHVFHCWSAQGALASMCVAGAEGIYFWDYDGNRFLDFSSQLVFTNVGHQHPKVVTAIQDQAAKLSTIAPQHANDARNIKGADDGRTRQEMPGLGVFWGLDLVTERATRAPLVPYGGKSYGPASPAMGEFNGECKKRGLMPFINYTCMHVASPSTVTETEAKEGLAILDEVYSIIDKHYVG